MPTILGRFSIALSAFIKCFRCSCGSHDAQSHNDAGGISDIRDFVYASNRLPAATAYSGRAGAKIPQCLAQAEIIAEVEGVTDPGGTSGGSVRVLRVFKGSLTVGSIMEFTGPTEVIVTCNSPPPLATNSRGIVFLRQGSTEFPGFLNPRMEAFVRQNLLGVD